MSTIYVSKSGFDGNSGLNYTLSKLTIQAAINLAISGDTVIVGAGSYSEALTINVKSISLLADGIVVLDGTGVASGLYHLFTPNGTYTITMSSLSTGGKWIIKNYSPSSTTIGAIHVYCNGGISSNSVVNLNNIEFYGNASNTIGVSINAVQNSGIILRCVFFKCIFSGFSNYCLYPSWVSQAGVAIYVQSSQCTFYNSKYAIFVGWSAGLNPADPLSFNINNIYHTISTGSYVAYLPTTKFNYNTYYNTPILMYNSGSSQTFTSLAQMQLSGSEVNGSILNPNLLNPVNNVFYPTSSVANNAGAYLYSPMTYGTNNSDNKWLITGSVDNSGWYSSDGLIIKNGTTKNFELSGSTISASIVSPVWNLGSYQTVTQINLAALETYPNAVIDTTVGGRPNYLTLRYRISSSVFNQSAATPVWIEIAREAPFAANGQYIQAELTLRNNDLPT